MVAGAAAATALAERRAPGDVGTGGRCSYSVVTSLLNALAYFHWFCGRNCLTINWPSPYPTPMKHVLKTGMRRSQGHVFYSV